MVKYGVFVISLMSTDVMVYKPSTEEVEYSLYYAPFFAITTEIGAFVGRWEASIVMDSVNCV